MCTSQINQTHDEVFSFMEENDLNPHLKEHPGIGIFLIPAPEIGILEYKAIEVADLSYRETVKRGSSCNAFQWIPYGITAKRGDEDVPIQSLEDFYAARASCPDRCKASGCPWASGCFCRSGGTGWCRGKGTIDP